ncbi:hypothetical protein Sa4125_00330 [Aureimonas sp. SA4125]|uniref:hypothetical protein n=1 Tax=Aureimonas sp. SA4125 TaxID=2826993 RepID=UPI001CC52085|nr:hypothetical protein [Aureimonas sp. SA4125]BDA82491.1 hypothetical protein Sa4125_00330 [Aureimonas sp. SA4125]
MRMETKALAAIKAGDRTIEDYGTASCSEWLTLCLALDRHDQLVGTGYETPSVAWGRLDDRQRAIVRAADPSYAPAGR